MFVKSEVKLTFYLLYTSLHRMVFHILTILQVATFHSWGGGGGGGGVFSEPEAMNDYFSLIRYTWKQLYLVNL